MQKLYLFFLLVVLLCPEDGFAVQVSGQVTDQMGTPLAGVKILFVNSGSTARFETTTDAFGNYQIEMVTSVKNPEHAATALFCYPNPFNRQTVISFNMNRQQDVELAVYDMIDRKSTRLN